MTAIASLVDLLDSRARHQSDKRAFVFLADDGRPTNQLTFGQLRAASISVAARLVARGARAGDRAMLAFPPGLDFIVALFGCLTAGLVAVPLPPPRRAAHGDTSAGVLVDCSPRFGLASAGASSPSVPDGVALEWISLPVEPPTDESGPDAFYRPSSDSLALLQYTSGSTSSPKGVMLSHANLLANLEMIRGVFQHSEASTHVSWLPLHHDMGLILNVLAALHAGATCVLMAPVSFLQRPLTWLKAIDTFGATVAGGPNFGFDLCVSRFRPEVMEGVDLSRWQVAINGAEPVRTATMERFSAVFGRYGFRPSAFRPSYGLAEASVLVSAAREWESPVSCGPALAGEELAIVDPVGCTRLEAGQVGEIWVRGPNVAAGYWCNREASDETFGGMIAGEPDARWLRTGDLGHLDRAGVLFVAGRLKDLIIVRGINHYPQDIEDTVQAADPALRAGFGAAFSVPDADSLERVIVVQEVERSRRHALDVEEIVGTIREAVAEKHGLALHDVLLVDPGSIPRTTSGKIRRQLTRMMWQEGRLTARLIRNGGYSPARTDPR